MKPMLVLLVVTLSAVNAAAQQAAGQHAEEPDTLYQNCMDLPGEKRFRSDILESPDGTTAAYAEVRIRDCNHSSYLWLRAPGAKDFELVYFQAPTEMLRGNGIRAVDWSPDGKALLVYAMRWQIGSDAGVDSFIYLLDPGSKVLTEFRFRRFFEGNPEGCREDVQPLGFMRDGRMVVSADSNVYFEVGEEAPINASCMVFKHTWAAALDASEDERLADDYVVKKFGKRREHQPSAER